MDPRYLLIRVLRGNATRLERKQLEEWLDSLDSKSRNSMNPENQSQLQLVDLIQIRRLVFETFRRQRKKRFYIITAIVSLFILVTAVAIRFSNKQTVLIFHDATLDKIIPQIESNYSVTITIDSSIQNCRFTGEFHQVESVQEFLSVLSTATGLQYREKSADHFEITGKPCN